MKTKTFADGLPHTDVAAQTIDKAAVICVNSSSVKIGKGSDESYAIYLIVTAPIKNSIIKV